MGFSLEWNQRYNNNSHLSIWPWSDLVSYVNRYTDIQKSPFRVLEIGCGAGANIPFFTSIGARYYAIDGSKTIIQKLKKKFPKLYKNLIACDFTEEIPFDMSFDLVVDRAALTHNSTSEIKQCLDFVHKKLKNNGKYIGIDWFSTSHSDFKNGVSVKDRFTRSGYKDGQFAHVGKVHFSDKKHLYHLFKKFRITVLQKKVVKTIIPKNEFIFSSWNLVAEKYDF